MVVGETGKRAPSLFIPMSKQRDKSSILWKSYESLSCLLILLQKHRHGEISKHYLKRRGGVDICAWLRREHLGKFCFPKALQFFGRGKKKKKKVRLPKGKFVPHKAAETFISQHIPHLVTYHLNKKTIRHEGQPRELEYIKGDVQPKMK